MQATTHWMELEARVVTGLPPEAALEVVEAVARGENQKAVPFLFNLINPTLYLHFSQTKLIFKMVN